MKNNRMLGKPSTSIVLGMYRAKLGTNTRLHLHVSTVLCMHRFVLFAKQPTVSGRNGALHALYTKQSMQSVHTKRNFLSFAPKSKVFLQKSFAHAKTYSKNAYKPIYKHSNVASRFSTSLVGRGKKGLGCRFLLQSLAISRRASLNRVQNNALSATSLKKRIVCKHSLHTRRQQLPDAKETSKVSVQRLVLQNNAFVANQKTNEQNFERHNMVRNNILSDNGVQNNSTEQSSYKAKSLLPCTKQSFVSQTKQQKGYKLCQTLFINKSKGRIAWLCQKAMQHIKPIVETRKVRRGGNTYMVPFALEKRRQEGIAIRWLIESCVGRNVQSRASYTPQTTTSRFVQSGAYLALYCTLGEQKKRINLVSEALLDSLKNTGQAVEKRNKVHQLALQNRAYMHYRWW